MDNTISKFLLQLEQGMFPLLDQALSPRSAAHLKVIRILEFIQPEKWFVTHYSTSTRGRPKADRDCIARAFIAKTVLNIPTTVALIDRLQVDIVLRRICGWYRTKLPCEASFSNAFSEFAETRILEKMHAEIIKEQLKDDLIFHISRDSTAIQGREKVVKKVEPKKIKFKRGRPAKGEVRPQKELPKLQEQLGQSQGQLVAAIYGSADFGAKRDSHGNQITWPGYKLHLDFADGGIPISCLLTPASVHDARVSLPLQNLTESRVNFLYLLADKAYDAKEIRNRIADSGKVGIIPFKDRQSKFTPELENFEKRRFRTRSTAERGNSALKENFGARAVMVRGAGKVMCHLMLGVLVLAADTLLRLS